ncbi:MAG: triple tyrosine motif-containing protein, partial [Bacteroidota bacterium]
MKWPNAAGLILSLVFCAVTNAQELPPIQNFTPLDYSGENQNWAIAQGADKRIFAANGEGLLEYNGANWRLYPSPNETIMRSVAVVEDRIYTGCFMEFGYWERNVLGQLQYISLSQSMKIDLLEDEEFWTILQVDDYLLFQSLKRIYIYNVKNGSVQVISAKGPLTKTFNLNGLIYFHSAGEGIFRIVSGKQQLIFDDSIVRSDEVVYMFNDGERISVVTRQNGFFHEVGGKLVPSNAFPNDYLSRFSIYNGTRLHDGSFVLGTISNGLLFLTATGELSENINQTKGLYNNTVLYIFEDIDNNLWAGLDHGISYINKESPFRVFDDFTGTIGSVYASAIHGHRLYLGTNQGLFYKSLQGDDRFRFIQGTEGQVWSLRVLDRKLLCGHHRGTWVIEGDKVVPITNVPGTWDIRKLEGKENLLLQGNYDGLYVLQRTKESWVLRNKIEGFNYSSRFFECLENQVFVSHEYNGVFQLEVDNDFRKVVRLGRDTLIKGANSGIVRYKDQILYAFKHGVLRYDPQLKGFTKDSLLSTLYTPYEYESGKLLVDESGDVLWAFNKSHLAYASPTGLTNALKINRVPLTKKIREGITGYENLTTLSKGSYLLGKTSGYLTADIPDLKINPFQVSINQVIRIRDTLQIAHNPREEGFFKSTENNLEISFFAPLYNKMLEVRYQYRLKGMYDTWSPWTKNSSIFYENLPHGQYIFEVRAQNGETFSANTAFYNFSIARPWYISYTMLTIYALGIALFSWFMHTRYKRYYSRQRQKLILKNKQELEL